MKITWEQIYDTLHISHAMPSAALFAARKCMREDTAEYYNAETMTFRKTI